VLVITHDDRYFHLADRLIRMENGQVISGGMSDSSSITKSHAASLTLA